MSREPLNFLFATAHLGGNVSPVMPVVQRLAAAGNVVRVMSDDVNRADAQAAGARFRSWVRAPMAGELFKQLRILASFRPQFAEALMLLSEEVDVLKAQVSDAYIMSRDFASCLLSVGMQPLARATTRPAQGFYRYLVETVAYPKAN